MVGLTTRRWLLSTLGIVATVALLINLTLSHYAQVFSAESSALFQTSSIAHGTALYADESSPLYLEPYRHEDTDNVAWKWAADLRSRKSSLLAPSSLAASTDIHASKAVAVKKQSATSKLAEVDSDSRPCPWYGCADGSHAYFSENEPRHIDLSEARQKPKEQVKPKSVQDPKQTVPKLSQAKKVISLATKVEKSVNQQKLFAHGFGTTNAFTAKPLTATKNQFYGGSPRFYGSKRPVTSSGGFVDGSQAYSVDMAPAYDASDPTSFDSIPLASPSSPESRIALAQPAGDGTLAQNLFR
jgi:hypothetical protein